MRKIGVQDIPIESINHPEKETNTTVKKQMI